MSHDFPPEFAGRGEIMLGFAKSAAADGHFFFYVRIPQPVGPLDRGDLYEDPLQEELADAKLGEITGGGSQLGEDDTIAYCGLDVVVTDHDRGLALIRETMQRLGAPAGTVIEEYLPTYREHPIYTN
jgi:hypothetical protein